jgi:hypothetical protein
MHCDSGGPCCIGPPWAPNLSRIPSHAATTTYCGPNAPKGPVGSIGLKALLVTGSLKSVGPLRERAYRVSGNSRPSERCYVDLGTAAKAMQVAEVRASSTVRSFKLC